MIKFGLYIFGRNITEVNVIFFSLYSIRQRMISNGLVIDVYFDHLRLCLPGFFMVKFLFFAFVFNSYFVRRYFEAL